FNLVALHDMDDILERGILGHRSYIRSHHVADLAAARLHVLGRSRPGLIRNSIHLARLRWVPVSARRSKSPSVTIPTRRPPASTTGKPLNLRSSISRMASVIEASGEIHMGSGVMTSAALMASPPHLNFAHV